jgi:hypothetical protein
LLRHSYPTLRLLIFYPKLRVCGFSYPFDIRPPSSTKVSPLGLSPKPFCSISRLSNAQWERLVLLELIPLDVEEPLDVLVTKKLAVRFVAVLIPAPSLAVLQISDTPNSRRK